MTRLHPLPVALVLGSLAMVCRQTTGLGLPGLTCLLLVVLSAQVPGTRRHLVGVGLLAVGGLTLWWGLIGLLFSEPGVGGPVIVELPRYHVGPSVDIGGPVYLSTLIASVSNALRAGIVPLAVLLMFQLVPAERWLDLADVVLGGVADLLAVLLCFPGALATSLRDRTRLARHHLAPPLSDVMADAAAGAVDKAEAWRATRTRPRSAWGRLVGVTVLTVVIPLGVYNAVSTTALPYSVEVTDVGKALVGAVILVRLIRPGLARLGGLTARDVWLLVAAGAVVAAGMLRDHTGDADLLMSGSPWAIPPVLTATVLAAVAVVWFVVCLPAPTPTRRPIPVGRETR